MKSYATDCRWLYNDGNKNYTEEKVPKKTEGSTLFKKNPCPNRLGLGKKIRVSAVSIFRRVVDPILKGFPPFWLHFPVDDIVNNLRLNNHSFQSAGTVFCAYWVEYIQNGNDIFPPDHLEIPS